MTTGKLLYLHPDQVQFEEDFNVRFDMGDIGSLQKQIDQWGIRVPIKVKKLKGETVEIDGKEEPVFVVIDGHRRTKCAKALTTKKGDEYVEIPAWEIEKEALNADMVLEMLVTGDSAQPLNMLEKAYAIERLMNPEEDSEEEAMTQSEIARFMGKSPAHVGDCLMLLKAPKNVIKEIKAGKMSATTAVEMMKANTIEEVEEVVEKTSKKKTAEGKGDKKITKKDLDDTAGKSVTKKPKAGGTGTATREGAKNEAPKSTGKNSGAINELENMQEALEAQTDVKAKPDAFAALEGVIQLLKGEVEPFELTDIFFETPAGGKKAAAPKKANEATVKTEKKEEPKKVVSAGDRLQEKIDKAATEKESAKKTAKKTPAKKAASKKEVEEEDEDDDEEDEVEEAPKKKTASKKAAAPAKKKATKKEVEEEDEEYDELEDDEEMEDDADDFDEEEEDDDFDDSEEEDEDEDDE